VAVCKTVHPVLADRCLFCLSVLTVTLVYCGETVGWIKMKLGMQVGLGPGHIVLDGDPAPPSQKEGRAPSQFSAHFNCGQMAGCIKMPLFMKVGLVPGHIVLDGDPAPPPKNMGTAPNLGPCLMSNCWMDQDPTWYGGRPRPRRHCVRWGPCSP